MKKTTKKENKVKITIVEKNRKSDETRLTPDKKIEEAVRAIKTKFGDDAIMMLGDAPRVDVNAISTGSIGLDAALGVGGLPPPRII